MISLHDFYNVMSAVIPLYVAMILAYGSVRWWKILTPDQCSGINRFVAVFAVPLLSFQIIARQNPYQFNVKFVTADAMQKFLVLGLLGTWVKFSRKGSIDWMITLFMLATLPNTLVVGVPLITAMYGQKPASIVIQAVVLQSIVWYTILLFLYEYRSARLLILQKFPRPPAVAGPKVDPSAAAAEPREVKTEASIGDDGKIYVQLLKSPTSRSASPKTPQTSSTSSTPTASYLSNAEIYSVHSSKIVTPTNSFNCQDFYVRIGSSPFRASSPEASDWRSEKQASLEEHFRDLVSNQKFSHQASQIIKKENDALASANFNYDAKELQMFVWSSSTSPAASPVGEVYDKRMADEERTCGGASTPADETTLQIPEEPKEPAPTLLNQKEEEDGPDVIRRTSWLQKLRRAFIRHKTVPIILNGSGSPPGMPSTLAMLRMILNLVWKKLVTNPNTYASVLGLTWALVKFRWNAELPKILDGSIRILSDAGLGMAMFSLGLFMALQPKLLACGTYMTIIGMIVRFVTGPAIMSATSAAVGLHGLDLRASLLQAALSQGIVPFVFAKQYNVHPDILSTAVILGMLVSLPVTLLYYVLLGL